MGNVGKSARFTKKVTLSVVGLDADLPGELSIAAPLGELTTRQVVVLEGQPLRGALSRIVLAITNRVGLAPTALDLHIFDTDNITDPLADQLNGPRLIYSNTGNAVGAGTKQLLINDVRSEPVDFITKGPTDQGKLSIAIVLTGGDGTTKMDYNLQLYGEEK
jgi:hypothetical protein